MFAFLVDSDHIPPLHEFSDFSDWGSLNLGSAKIPNAGFVVGHLNGGYLTARIKINWSSDHSYYSPIDGETEMTKIKTSQSPFLSSNP